MKKYKNKIICGDCLEVMKTIKQYLSQTKSPNYYDWIIFSGLGYLDASKEWMEYIELIKKHKLKK